VPYIDEWEHETVLAGEKQVSAEWLWAPHGEHRVPLAKLVWVTVVRVTKSFKAGVYINVLLFGALAFAMLRTAQALPGGLDYADAILPIQLLHIGQGFNLQWWWQIMENLPSIIIGVLTVAVVRGGPGLAPRSALFVGAGLMLLPLCGPSGLPCALAMSLWLGVWGIRSILASDKARRSVGIVVLGMAIAALLLIGLYFVGLEKPEHMPGSPGPVATLRTRTPPGR
jgi:hypothetical protein